MLSQLHESGNRQQKMKKEVKANAKQAIKNQVLCPFKLIKAVNKIAASTEKEDAQDKQAILAYMSELGVSELKFEHLLTFTPDGAKDAVFCTLSKIPYEFEELSGAVKLAYEKKGVKWYYKKAALTIPSFIACIGARVKFETESVYDMNAKLEKEKQEAEKAAKEKQRKQARKQKEQAKQKGKK